MSASLPRGATPNVHPDSKDILMHKTPTPRALRPAHTLVALAVLALAAACSTVSDDTVLLGQARSEQRAALADADTQALAPNELRLAGEALAQAEAARQRGDSLAEIDQLAYLARQRTGIARETGARKAAEARIAQAGAETDRMRLAARTQQADNATAAAAAATQDAAASQRNAAASQRDAAASQRDAAASQRQAEASQRNAAASQQQAGDAERRSAMLATQLRELNAQQTDRGLVITLGDVLFDTGRARLRPGAAQNLQRLGSFLKEYPQRKALIEGHTDSVGGEQMNQALSGQRAETVMGALLAMGVARGQVAAQGYGETSPVADNDSATGRQANRRVEIVLSDENGAVKGR
jgi:outer membrane protein OmpA-like peptidoglycan-associated protein